MTNDVMMWLIVLFGGLFTLVAIGAFMLRVCFRIDLMLSKLRTPATLDLILVNSCFFLPLIVYCYFWYTVAMSLAEQI